MKRLLVFSASFLLLFSFHRVLAAGIILEPNYYQENGQKYYEIGVYFDSKGESFNALEGKLLYPPKDLKFQKTINGGSIINLWIKDPQLQSDGALIFSGGMPGGYSGEKGLLFKAIFKPADNSASNPMKISAREFKAYLNNKTGTQISLQDSEMSITPQELKEIVKEPDTKPPEVFAPYITQDPNLSGDLWVLIFYAQDKGEGIDHYEVMETKEKYKPEEISKEDSRWEIAGTGKLYILKDQSLSSFIYVKAVDKSGNSRVAIVMPPDKNNKWVYNSVLIAAVFVIFLAAVSFLALKILPRKNKKTVSN